MVATSKRYVHSELVNVPSLGKRDFADVIRLGIPKVRLF
jgi:hypothetical protein